MIAVFSVVKLFFFGLLSLISIILGALLYPFRINEVMMLIMRKFWSPVVLKLLGVKVKIEGFDKVDNYIGNGKVVIIFPEGTKSKDGNIAIFKKGGFHLAQQAQTQILPIKIKGAREVWPNKRPFCLRRGVIKLIIGTPIQPKELQSMEIGAQAEHVRSIITNL